VSYCPPLCCCGVAGVGAGEPEGGGGVLRPWWLPPLLYAGCTDHAVADSCKRASTLRRHDGKRGDAVTCLLVVGNGVLGRHRPGSHMYTVTGPGPGGGGAGGVPTQAAGCTRVLARCVGTRRRGPCGRTSCSRPCVWWACEVRLGTEMAQSQRHMPSRDLRRDICRCVPAADRSPGALAVGASARRRSSSVDAAVCIMCAWACPN